MDFIQADIISVRYRDNRLFNKPINLEKVVTFYKDSYAEYPDNRGIPTIMFITEYHKITWYFYSESERDNVYEKICDYLSLYKIRIKVKEK